MSEINNKRFKITFSGEIKEGYTREQVQTYLAGVYKTTPEKIAHLFSGKTYVLKEKTDAVTAKKYNSTFDQAGAVCRIKSIPDVTDKILKLSIQTKPVKTKEPTLKVATKNESSPEKKKQMDQIQFKVDSVVIHANRTSIKNNKVEGWQLWIGSRPLLTLKKKNRRKHIRFNGSTEKHKLTAWYETGKESFNTLSTGKEGIGIIVDKKPVESTLADPIIAKSNGYTGIWLFIALLGFKAIWPFLNQSLSFSIEDKLENLAIYGIPVVILILLTIIYKKTEKTALIAALIVGSLETIDFLVGTIQNMSNGDPSRNSGLFFLIWLGLRISAIIWILRGLRAVKIGANLIQIAATTDQKGSY